MILTYGTNNASNPASEEQEMATIFNWLRVKHPRYHAVAVHVRNEGKRHARQMAKIKAQGGFVKGAADVHIAGCPSMVCEIKPRKKTAKLSKEQVEYLNASIEVGAFACLAYGADGFVEAFSDWLNVQQAT